MITRRLFLVIFAALLLFTAGCATAPRMGEIRGALSSQAVKIDGKSYIPLTLIAGYYQARCEWDPVARRADLIKENKIFAFYVGMDYAAINGKPERLSSPVVFYEGSAAIPADFAINSIARVLSPPRITGPRPPVTQKYLVRKVVIDAGHGGNDPGAVGRTGLKEKDLVLDVARRVKEQLNENGVDVVMTRDRDRFIPLEKRSQIANENNVDFFVSIHANSARLKGAKGFEVYYLSTAVDDNARAVEAAENSFLKFDDSSFQRRNTDLEATLWDLVYTENREESIELARNISKSVDASTSLYCRGVKSARFYVLKGAQMPAVLVEIGFISNPAEEKDLKSASCREDVASAIAKGILNYKKIYESTDGFTK
ncbi:MAG: N-acetylmuramoyl-L-alanine amidase [Candidatus Omnitrophota bacterium]|jgi:N-acetylmuramoyl-L-alanine amidase